jgi:hypothetical protein
MYIYLCVSILYCLYIYRIIFQTVRIQQNVYKEARTCRCTQIVRINIRMIILYCQQISNFLVQSSFFSKKPVFILVFFGKRILG